MAYTKRSCSLWKLPSFFTQQKSIAKRPPPNILLNYNIVLSEHAHCLENYVRQVLGERDELPDSEEVFNASQMNTKLQNMFAINAAAAYGSEFKDSSYYVDLPWIENRVNRVPSNFHELLKVLDRTMTSLRKKINLMKRTMRSFFNMKRMESLRD